MKIIVNGEEISLPEDSNIQDLVVELGYINKRIAIEVNETIIPKSKHRSHLLDSLDRVEVINAVGGG
ncbi:MAG: sulfur carrier protein ThiS [Candidatus Pseudothioglobus sp.]